MLTFRYKAALADGSVVRGYRSGHSRNDVVSELQAMGQVPIRVDSVEAPPESGLRKRLRWRQSRITQTQIADLTRELSTLLRAGFPLDRALTVLLSLEEGTPLGGHLSDIQDRVKEGATLADAVEAQGKLFSRFYVNLLRAGESGGALEVVLERLADHLENSKEVRDALVSALIYPAVLILVALSSIFVLLGYVVPQFAEMFDGAEQALPLSTQITIGVGGFLQNYGWLVIVLVTIGVVLAHENLKDESRLRRAHAWMLSLPMVGELVLKSEVARFARTLSILLHNGVVLLKALEIVRDTLTNRALAEHLEQVTNAVRHGRNLADPLSELTPFPAFAVHMIRVGEESGSLQQILTQVADSYERDTQTAIKRSLSVLEPVLILVLGAIIAGVIISILLAILSINELVI